MKIKAGAKIRAMIVKINKKFIKTPASELTNSFASLS